MGEGGAPFAALALRCSNERTMTLRRDEAERLVDKHLGVSPRAAHSRLVAAIIRELAGIYGGDSATWEAVGLCHDLDFFETSADPTRHGLLTLEWLGNRLPADARDAIAAHDYRTGVVSDTLLADMLKLADVVAVIDVRLGRKTFCDINPTDPYVALRDRLADRRYLSEMLERLAGKHELRFSRVVEIVSRLR
jgi:hypothetical protein